MTDRFSASFDFLSNWGIFGQLSRAFQKEQNDPEDIQLFSTIHEARIFYQKRLVIKNAM
jgi:hypothetical protein